MPHRAAPSQILLLLLALLTGTASVAAAQSAASQIRLNQIGFYPEAPKTAVVVGAPTSTFHLVTPDAADTVYTGTMTSDDVWPHSEERVRRAVFTDFETPGTYSLLVPELGLSHPFEIMAGVHQDIARAAIKMYYFQRASMRLEPEYAGLWFRKAGHPDDEVIVHPSAASEGRPAGSTIATPRGWYDAGDYNKYVVNSGISTGTLLMLYEHYPTYFDALETDIPESGNSVPDLLDEILWNVRWMMTMQDPADGGVYNKTTHAGFSGGVMPHQATAPRYVVQKGTAATLDFAAVAALAARLYDDFDDELPGLADSLRAAALDAWEWAIAHPDIPYDQDAMNAQYDPDIWTGGYGDGNFDDEFAWAAAELLVTTGEEQFAAYYDELASSSLGVPGWPNVGALGAYSLLHHRANIAALVDTAEVKRRLLVQANGLVGAKKISEYDVVIGGAGGFWWGSNSEVGNQAMLLMQAYRLTGQQDYFDAALANLDYLLGRNATGYSFVTGHGDHTPVDPHHRQSYADAIRAPVPGMLVGGPNAGQQDDCAYPSDLPAKSYVDDWCSYASNEITINWNAPLAYVAGAIEATLSPTGLPLAAQPPVGPQPVTSTRASLRVDSYPSPVRERATLRLTIGQRAPVTVSVFDLLGREVRHLPSVVLTTGVHERQLDLRGLPAGLYIVRVQTPETSATHPVTVVR